MPWRLPSLRPSSPCRSRSSLRSTPLTSQPRHPGAARLRRRPSAGWWPWCCRGERATPPDPVGPCSSPARSGGSRWPSSASRPPCGWPSWPWPSPGGVDTLNVVMRGGMVQLDTPDAYGGPGLCRRIRRRCRRSGARQRPGRVRRRVDLPGGQRREQRPVRRRRDGAARGRHPGAGASPGPSRPRRRA